LLNRYREIIPIEGSNPFLSAIICINWPFRPSSLRCPVARRNATLKDNKLRHERRYQSEHQAPKHQEYRSHHRDREFRPEFNLFHINQNIAPTIGAEHYGFREAVK
jgi:hypothetical protein